MEVDCATCSKKFHKPMAWIRKVNTHYCSRDCYKIGKVGTRASVETRKKMSEKHRGSNNHRWKGGKYLGVDGYIHIRIIDEKRYIREHQFVMESAIGRKLKRGEVVHHKNGLKTDNRISNLELLTQSQHKKLHGNQHAPKHLHNSN